MFKHSRTRMDFHEDVVVCGAVAGLPGRCPAAAVGRANAGATTAATRSQEGGQVSTHGLRVQTPGPIVTQATSVGTKSVTLGCCCMGHNRASNACEIGIVLGRLLICLCVCRRWAKASSCMSTGRNTTFSLTSEACFASSE